MLGGGVTGLDGVEQEGHVLDRLDVSGCSRDRVHRGSGADTGLGRRREGKGELAEKGLARERTAQFAVLRTGLDRV